MDAITLTNRLEQDYRRYLETTFYFRDPDLRQSFSDELASGLLVKGPYLEGAPSFVRGSDPGSLLSSLDAGFDAGFASALGGGRPLYSHQERAIRSVLSGRNIVVATGTGSGKTEAFLFPILVHLYLEYLRGTLGSGVRALIVYPMNALANDQRARLGEIALSLDNSESRFRFTFGQYTGDTPESPTSKCWRSQNSGVDRLPGELVYRSEMRDSPPHILLTNFSMLEYLLVRPKDSPLFDEGNSAHWQYIVLDEAHQYKGTKGIEIGMLLRRLKRRLRDGGRKGPFQCIATSATLFNDETEKPKVAEFASRLFGECFASEDIVSSETHPVEMPQRGQLDAADYRQLLDILERVHESKSVDLNSLTAKVGVCIEDAMDSEDLVHKIVNQDRRAAEIRSLVQQEPAEAQELVVRYFSEVSLTEGRDALQCVVRLLARSNDSQWQTPMLQPRYHVFIRSLEGAFLSFVPSRRVLLSRVPQKDECFFELALCHECGQHYLVGRIQDGFLREARRDPSSADFDVLFFRPAGPDDVIEFSNETPVHTLCTECGAITKGDRLIPVCGHKNRIRVQQLKKGSEEDRVSACSACGYRSFDPVREFVYGSHGPTSVLASTLTSAWERKTRRPKLLAFSDGRQEAAYFAYYLEDSTKSLQERSLLLEAGERITQPQEGVSLSELATGVQGLLEEKGFVRESDGATVSSQRAWEIVLREFLTEQSRISLEGVGAVTWQLKWPSWLPVPTELCSAPWSLDERLAKTLLSHLLGTLRGSGAVELPHSEGLQIPWDALGRSGPQTMCKIGPPRGDKSVVRWDSADRNHGDYLMRILTRKNPGAAGKEEIEGLLRSLWERMVETQLTEPAAEHLLTMSSVGRRLNYKWWRMKPVREEAQLFQCDTCGRLTALNLYDVCPRYRCSGSLVAVIYKQISQNHYRARYLEPVRGPLRVEEHTAQLSRQCASEYQREFRDGHIQVLSSSTTFELGVDLGDLETILLRNVPPESFNYAQRIGRAGRRQNSTGFAVTYCRRGAHDLYHFNHPELMIKGRIQAPSLDFCNARIAQRHLLATALGAFFRAYPERFTNVSALLGDMSAPHLGDDFEDFIQNTAYADLSDQFREILPEGLHTGLGISEGSWPEWMTKKDGQLQLACMEAAADYVALQEVKKWAYDQNKRGLLSWAMKRIQTLESEDVLSFLSRKVVIPKYGFPVDLVELDVLTEAPGSNIALQRDLTIALSEFAPSSRIVANKQQVTSYALKRVPEREWERNWYGRCPVHGTFQVCPWTSTGKPAFKHCCDAFQTSSFLVPQFGFTTNREGPSRPTGRPQRLFSTRPYFAGFEQEPSECIELGWMTLYPASPGSMAVICEGKRGGGFFVCGRCGAGFVKAPTGNKPHRNAFGEPCSGKVFHTCLGHRFKTDVLKIDFRLSISTDDDAWFTQSLASALTQGTSQALQVPTTDINAVGWHPPDPPHHRIVLYDDVPGGAGLVAKLQDTNLLHRALLEAYERVAHCPDCALDSSCYACLRSYRNQFAHENMKRGPVAEYLQRILNEL